VGRDGSSVRIRV
jgi:hypothetical protein